MADLLYPYNTLAEVPGVARLAKNPKLSCPLIRSNPRVKPICGTPPPYNLPCVMKIHLAECGPYWSSGLAKTAN